MMRIQKPHETLCSGHSAFIEIPLFRTLRSEELVSNGITMRATECSRTNGHIGFKAG